MSSGFVQRFIWLLKELGTHMRDDRAGETDPNVKAALERKWVLMYATRKVFEHYFPNGKWKDELRKTYKGDWTLGEGNKGKLFLQIYKAAKSGVVTAYRNSKTHDPEFVHRNWMRSKETPGEITKVLESIIFPNLPPLVSGICKLGRVLSCWRASACVVAGDQATALYSFGVLRLGNGTF